MNGPPGKWANLPHGSRLRVTAQTTFPTPTTPFLAVSCRFLHLASDQTSQIQKSDRTPGFETANGRPTEYRKCPSGKTRLTCVDTFCRIQQLQAAKAYRGEATPATWPRIWTCLLWKVILGVPEADGCGNKTKSAPWTSRYPQKILPP